MNRTRALIVAGATAAAAIAAAAPAPAIDAAKPSPCTGTPLITDPAGDQELNPLLPGAPTTQPANMDIKSVFLNHRPDKDGKPVLTMNMQIANLDKSVPPRTESQGGVYYYFIYDLAGTVKFVAAHNTGSAINYEYGTIDPDIGTYTTEGDTVGQFFEGPDGVVQIDVPESVGGKVGDKLGGLIGTTDGIDIGTDHHNGLNNHADMAPDDSSVLEPDGKDYTVTPCPAGAGPSPTPDPGGTPTPTPTPDPGTGGGGGGGGGGTGGGAEPTVLPVRFSSSLGSARKAKKGRRLTVKATADRPVSNLVLKLKKLGGKGPTLASGKAASLKAGTTRLKIKVLKKRLKRGTYSLIATGTVDGRKLQVGQKVGLR